MGFRKNTATFWGSIRVSLDRGPALADITMDLEALVKNSAIINGSLMANVVGSTGSLTSIEYEPGVVQDLTEAIERLAPEGLDYAHERAWRDGNGHSHVQAALLGPSICLAVREGRLALGTWQQVVCINHDARPRDRRVEVTITGA